MKQISQKGRSDVVLFIKCKSNKMQWFSSNRSEDIISSIDSKAL